MMPVDPIASEIQALQRLGLSALRDEWHRRWGDPPKFRSRDHVLRAVAYRVQAEAYGGLPAGARRRLAEYAKKFSGDRKFTPTPGVALKPGSSLIREWGGQRHEVAVTADGFSYLGEPYRSLSKVAHTITGTKWNGPVFFGLKPRGGKSA